MENLNILAYLAMEAIKRALDYLNAKTNLNVYQKTNISKLDSDTADHQMTKLTFLRSAVEVDGLVAPYLFFTLIVKNILILILKEDLSLGRAVLKWNIQNWQLEEDQDMFFQVPPTNQIITFIQKMTI